tara:strand:- start:2666 stop:3346 length:681 start_codon:yes stop_codon:yes gene_type:complete
MKKIIKRALDDMKDSQLNLSSDATRETVATLISTALKSKYSFTKHNNSVTDDEIESSWVCNICDESTFDVEYDYLGSGTNHLGCELELEKDKDLKHFADGFHEGEWERDMKPNYNPDTKGMTGHDHGMVWKHDMGGSYLEKSSDIGREEFINNILEQVGSRKIAEHIADTIDSGVIYESPDDGKTIFQRKFMDYNPNNKEEIDWETKKPTGKKFTEYPFNKKKKGN